MGEFVNRRQKDALEIYCRDAEEDDGSMMLTTFGTRLGQTGCLKSQSACGGTVSDQILSVPYEPGLVQHPD